LGYEQQEMDEENPVVEPDGKLYRGKSFANCSVAGTGKEEEEKDNTEARRAPRDAFGGREGGSAGPLQLRVDKSAYAAEFPSIDLKLAGAN
jgi:hypothetical protein